MKCKPVTILLVCVVVLVIVWGIIFNSLAIYGVALAYSLVVTTLMWVIQRAIFGKKR